MVRSGSSVAKYIKSDGTLKIVKHTFKEVVREVNTLEANV